MVRVLLMACVLGAVSVIVLQAILSHSLRHLRFRTGETRKLFDKRRAAMISLTEEVGRLDREIASAEAKALSPAPEILAPIPAEAARVSPETLDDNLLAAIEVAEKEDAPERENLRLIQGVGETIQDKLYAAGFFTIESVAIADEEELAAAGFTPGKAMAITEAAYSLLAEKTE